MVPTEGKRRFGDIKMVDKHPKLSEAGKPDKGQPVSETSVHKRKKNKKCHADDKKKLVQKIDKAKETSETTERKDNIHKKKSRKKKQFKSKNMKSLASENITGFENITRNDKGHSSENVHGGASKQSQSNKKAYGASENEINSKKHLKRKRKPNDKLDEETKPSLEKRNKHDGEHGKDNVDRADKSLNSSSNFVRKETLGNCQTNSEKTKRTPLTDRQKHKRMKLKEKRKLKRSARYTKTDQLNKNSQEMDLSKGASKSKTETKTENKTETKTENKPKLEKVVLPKGPEDASANWKKLQLMLDSKKTGKQTKKVGQKPHPYRQTKKVGQKPHPYRQTKKVGQKPHPYRRNTKKLDKKKTGVNKHQLDKPADKSPAPDIWFDDVDEIYLEPAARSKPTVPLETEATAEPPNKAGDKVPQAAKNPLVKPNAYKGLTKAVSMDCEMVGVGDGKDNMLARVSIVNQHGEMIYDKFVKPMEDVVDFRTHVSGVRQEDIEKGEEFTTAQGEVANILKGRLLVGHAIMNDLKVLYLIHPKKRIRDTSRYKPFRQLFQGRTPSLKKLSAQVLGVKVQEGEHNSVQDAQAAMRLYTMYRKQWEADIKQRKQLKTKDKVLPVVDADSKKSVYQKKRDKSALDKRKKEMKKKEK